VWGVSNVVGGWLGYGRRGGRSMLSSGWLLRSCFGISRLGVLRNGFFCRVVKYHEKFGRKFIVDSLVLLGCGIVMDSGTVLRGV